MLLGTKLLSGAHFRNRSSAISSYVKGEAINAGMPTEILIEVTSFCNLACPMCGRGSKTTPNVYMDIDLFKRVIDQVKPYAEMIALSGGVGEPLAHPKIGEMIGYCRDAGLNVMLSTNATLLNEKKAAALLDNGLSMLILSLDGATKETHEQIRIGSNFEKTMKYVEDFLAEKTRRGVNYPTTIMQMIYMPINEREAQDFHRKWSGMPGVNSVRIKKLLSIEGAAMADDAGHPEYDGLSCFYPWRQFALAADGSVGLCCRDHNFNHPLHNVKTSTVEEIWNSEPFQEARRLLASGQKSEISLCNNCETLQTGAVTRLGLRLLDTFSIHSFAPAAEHLAAKLKFRL
jgi:radical SAM protein with 4Fe4S-binding SPASM domain